MSHWYLPTESLQDRIIAEIRAMGGEVRGISNLQAALNSGQVPIKVRQMAKQGILQVKPGCSGRNRGAIIRLAEGVE